MPPLGKKKVKSSHGKTCGTQHRVGAWKVTVSFLPDVSSSLALDLPAKAVVRRWGRGALCPRKEPGVRGAEEGPEKTQGWAWEAEPSSALPIQPSPCLRTVPSSFHPSLSRSLWLHAYLSLMISLPPPLPANTWD